MTHVKGAGIVACPDFAAPGSPYCRWHTEIDAGLAARAASPAVSLPGEQPGPDAPSA